MVYCKCICSSNLYGGRSIILEEAAYQKLGLKIFLSFAYGNWNLTADNPLIKLLAMAW